MPPTHIPSTTVPCGFVQVTAYAARDGSLHRTPELAALRNIADDRTVARRNCSNANDKLRNFTHRVECGDTIDLDAMREAAVQVLSYARALNEINVALAEAQKAAGVK